MLGFSGLAKTIFLIFIILVIYKTRIYVPVLRFGDRVLYKIGWFKNQYAYHNSEGLKRKKYINKLLKKMKTDEEI